MKDWVPLFQGLIWPIFVGAIILWNRTWFKEFLDAIRNRIKEGSEVIIGPAGVSIGQAPSLSKVVSNEDIIDDGYQSEDETPSSIIEETSLGGQLSLSHRSTFWKMKNGRVYYRILITTHTENEDVKSQIEKVIYHLHPTFKNPVRVVATPENDFLLKTNGWGEFVSKAEVYVKHSTDPICLNRYIELKA